MRAIKALFCAAALTACLAPGVRADEYTKQTFLTFSGPVQLPGITLPAGTYQFKLADPDTGRRALQVWDKDGSKLLTTLLTIPDQRMKPTDKPVVMFSEAASGQAQPIRAWFYPNETYGQEFVYPKDQAMKIARDTHSSVLAFEDEAKDEAAFKSAKIGRVDENGRMSDANAESTTTASNNATDHDASKSASTTTASAATTTADHQSAQNTASSTAPRANTPMPSANRSDASAAAVGTSGTTTAPAAANTRSEANRDNMPSSRATGTTASTAQSTTGANAAAPRANANQQSTRRTLPRTAGSMMLVELLAGLSLAAAFALRVFRASAGQAR